MRAGSEGVACYEKDLYVDTSDVRYGERQSVSLLTFVWVGMLGLSLRGNKLVAMGTDGRG
jgi:hypothetical protein